MLDRLGWPLPDDLAHFLKFAFFTIIPRLILALALTLLFAGLDNYISLNEVIVFLILFSFLTFFILPPSVDALFVIKKSGNQELDDITYLKLLRACRDSSEGIYLVEGSLMIKSFYGRAMNYYERLKESHNFQGYAVSRLVKPLRGFNDRYCRLLEDEAWKLIQARSGAEVERYDFRRLDAIKL